MPVYGRFLGSSADQLWIGPLVPEEATLGNPNPVPEDETVWSVYSRAGLWLADVTFPPRFRLMDADGEYVAGVSRDADGVEAVVVFRLRR